MTAARRQKQRGVTLLEALIAVALLAMLSALLAPALSQGLRASRIVLEDASTKETGRVLENSFRQILSNAILMESKTELALKGDAQSLQLASLAGGSIARHFTLEIINGRLTGDIAPLLGDETPDQSVEILQRGAVAFSYYGRVNDDAPLAWSSRWNAARPPLLVRIEARLDPDSQMTRGFEFPIQARELLHCAFDPVSRQCRS